MSYEPTAEIAPAEPGDKYEFDGDVEAAFLEFHPKLIRFLYRKFGFDIDTCEEITSDVFVKVLEKHDQISSTGRPYFEAGSNFAAWVFRIAYNLGINAMRGRSRRPTDPYDPDSRTFVNVQAKDEIDDSEWRVMLEQIMSGDMPLPEHVQAHKEIVMPVLARVAMGYTPKEIGQQLGISHTTVGTRIHRHNKRASASETFEL